MNIKMMKHKWQAATLLACALIGGAPVAAQAQSAMPDTALAIVNGTPLPSDYAGLMLRDQSAAGTPVSDELRQQVAQQLVTNELLVQEAVKLGLDQNPDVVLRTEMARRDILANAYITWFLGNNPVDEGQVRQNYESRKAALADEREYSLRHILVASKEQGEMLIEQIRSGADFVRLVEEYSLDQGGSKNYGGSLGWTSVETADPQLISTAATLVPGQISPVPVETRFGWHVIRLDSTRDIQILPYEAVQGRLAQQIQLERVSDMERGLRQNSTITFGM